MTVSVAPNPRGREPELLARRSDGLDRVLAGLGGHGDRGRRARVLGLSGALGRLSPPGRERLLGDPLFNHWRTTTALRLRAGIAGDGVLDDLGPHVIAAMVAAGTDAELTATVAVTGDGLLELPGLGLDLRLAPGPGTIDVTLSAQDLVVRGPQPLTVRLEDLRRGAGHPAIRAHARIPGTAIVLHGGHAATLEELRRMNREEAEPPYPRRDLEPVPVPDAGLLTAYAGAYDLIARAWPELGDEIVALVRLVVPFDSELMVGWTSLLLEGALFIGAVADVPFLVERLVHEAAHTRLYVLQGLGRLHEHGAGELVSSPIRRDPRPVSGLYHATFVYARLIEAFVRLDRAGAAGPYWERAASLAEDFAAACSTLSGLRLTPLGAALLQDMQVRVDDVLQGARVGGP